MNSLNGQLLDALLCILVGGLPPRDINLLKGQLLDVLLDTLIGGLQYEEIDLTCRTVS